MNKKNIHDGHRRRVKDEFRKIGLDHFPPHKVLEMLLFYSIPRGDTNEIGHNLIERFGSISGVLDAPIELLKRTPGVGEESAAHIRLIGSIIRMYMESQNRPMKAIKNAVHAKEFMRHKFLAQTAECVYLVCLASGGKVLYSEKISQGTSKKVDIAPSKIVRVALLCDAAKVIIAHNHPGGICIPSSHDLHSTKLLYDELRRVDIQLMDHIIVATDGVFSMAENNMIP